VSASATESKNARLNPDGQKDSMNQNQHSSQGDGFLAMTELFAPNQRRRMRRFEKPHLNPDPVSHVVNHFSNGSVLELKPLTSFQVHKIDHDAALKKTL